MPYDIREEEGVFAVYRLPYPGEKGGEEKVAEMDEREAHSKLKQEIEEHHRYLLSSEIDVIQSITTTMAAVIIGSITFTGSLIAWAKLNGSMKDNPKSIPDNIGFLPSS